MKKHAENKPRVLVVDDDTRVIDTIAQGLQELDTLQISTCSTGASARQALARSPFDLLIADWHMPDADGIALLRQARAASPDIVSVLMTPCPSPEVDALAADSSVHHLLVKPFELEELIGIIRSVFPGRVPPPAQNKPPVYKIILGGDANVGKSTLITRYSTGRFNPAREMTIGIDFHVSDVAVENGRARLVVWDLGGQERFAPAREVFYRGTRAVGLVFDASNQVSFDNLIQWWQEVREYLDGVPVLLLANKVDLPRQVARRDVEKLAAVWKAPLFEASCASGRGVTEFFDALAQSAHKYATRRQTEKN